MSCLSKGLVSGTQAGKAAGVRGEEAGHAARPVVDLELRPVGLVGAGLGAVVPVVSSAGNLPDWTEIFLLKIFNFVVFRYLPGSRRDPEVAGARVKDNVEMLSRSAQLDGSVILSLQYRIPIQLAFKPSYSIIVLNMRKIEVRQKLWSD